MGTKLWQRIRFVGGVTALAFLTASISPSGAQATVDESKGDESTETVPTIALPGGDYEPLPVSPVLQPAAPLEELDGIFTEPTQGLEAVDALGDRLDLAATSIGVTAARLRSTLLADDAAWLDNDGRLFYAEPALDPHGPASEPVEPAGAPFPLQNTFVLHSKPGSNRTIYLDFDGHTSTGTAWEAAAGTSQYIGVAFDPAGNGASFTDNEREMIQLIWQRVAEDYAPFDVDVTTEAPADPEVIRRSSVGDAIYGTRVAITSSSTNCSVSTSGCAYVGVIDDIGALHDYYQPAWVYAPGLFHDLKNVAETVSHEAGHTLGLSHDGPGADGSAYYGGHDVWAPIMGGGFVRPLVQFSKGEYANPTNTEDDFVVMASNGLALRADDHTNDTTGTATLLVDQASGIIASQDDYDTFRYTPTVDGLVTLTALPFQFGPNLDIRLRLYAPNGTGGLSLVIEDNPTAAFESRDVATGLSAKIQTSLTGGVEYYVQVSGGSQFTGLDGFTRYGSIGQYTLSVEGATSTAPPNDDFADAEVLVGLSGTATGTNVASSGETGEPNHADSAPSTSVWWRFTAPTDGMVHLDTQGSGFDTTLGVYTGTTVEALTGVAANDDHPAATDGDRWSVVDVPVEEGTTYSIAIDGFDGAEGSIVLNYDFGPPNDDFADAITLVGGSGSFTGANVGASSETGEPDHVGLSTPVNSAWWSFTAPADGSLHVDTQGSSFDTTLAIYTGSEVGALTDVAANDDHPAATTGDRWSVVDFAVTSGVTYSIAVDGYADATGAIVLGYEYSSASSVGLLRVTTDPPVPARVLVDGVPRNDWGIEWVTIPTGAHEVCFSDIPGFITPPCENVVVQDGVTTSVVGAFAPLGLLKVEVAPAGLPTTVFVDGEPREEYGLYAYTEPGPHTVCWGDVAGFQAPDCVVIDVIAGAQTVVSGDFTPSATPAPGPAPDLGAFGFLRVTTDPAVVSRVIVDGVPRSDWATTWVKFPAGNHEVCFTDVVGYTAPGCQTVTIVEGETTATSGVFEALGLLKVEVSPAGLPIDVVVDGLARNQFGMYAWLEPGTYTICGTDTPGWQSPSCQAVDVTAGVQTTTTLTYAAP